MNKNFFAGLFAGLCLLAIFAFKPAAEKPVVAVQKWEYTHVQGFGTKGMSEIKTLGEEGWEMTGGITEGGYIFFKRPLQ
jgi:hypothetical protein